VDLLQSKKINLVTARKLLQEIISGNPESPSEVGGSIQNILCFCVCVCMYIYSVLSIYRFSREWRKQLMNAGKREIRKTTFLNKKSRTWSFASW
jgi:hypothetical protein